MIVKRLIDGEQSLQRATVKYPTLVNGQRRNRRGTIAIGVVEIGSCAVRRKCQAKQTTLTIAVGQVRDIKHRCWLERAINKAMNGADARNEIHRRITATRCGINGLIQRTDVH